LFSIKIENKLSNILIDDPNLFASKKLGGHHNYFSMDKLYQDTINKVYTDIEIVLIDPHNTISMHAHKCVLECMSIYFHNLFNFGKEKNQSAIKIKVNNAKVANDCIMLFYDQKINLVSHNEIKYLLEMFDCRQFFGLSNDVTLLYNIKVQPEEFDLFMQVIEEFDFINDKRLTRTIKKNIPIDYDLNNFTTEFINELQFNDYLIVSGSKDCNIRIWDPESGKLLNTLNKHTRQINNVTFSPDILKIASCDHDRSIKIWDVRTGKLLKTWNDGFQTIKSVVFSPDNFKIASGNDNGYIKIWDAETGQLLNTLDGHNLLIQNVAFSFDGLKIISCDVRNVKIWDSQSGKLLKIMRGHTDLIHDAIFSHDNLKIATCSRDKSIKIWVEIKNRTFGFFLTLKNMILLVSYFFGMHKHINY
jgi:WD40 repeat protein